MFNETAEKWFNKISENKVYVFVNGQVQLANKRYTSIKNDYCLKFGYDTNITECVDDLGIQKSGFSFTNIEQIKTA